MKIHTSRASARNSESDKRHPGAVASPVAGGTNKNILLDMIELLEEERRLNESRAFASQDASRKTTLEIAGRQCAAAISNLRRRLAPHRDSGHHSRTSKRQFDAYIDTMLDTCFVHGHQGSVRSVLDDGIPSAQSAAWRFALEDASFHDSSPS